MSTFWQISHSWLPSTVSFPGNLIFVDFPIAVGAIPNSNELLRLWNMRYKYPQLVVQLCFVASSEVDVSCLSTCRAMKTSVVGWRELLQKVDSSSPLNNKFWFCCLFFIKPTPCHATNLLLLHAKSSILPPLFKPVANSTPPLLVSPVLFCIFCRISISNGPSLALVDIVQKKLITVLSAQDMSGKGHFISDLSLIWTLEMTGNQHLNFFGYRLVDVF